MSARLQDRWNRMKSDGVIIQISFWEWNGVQIFVLIFPMSFTITPHRPTTNNNYNLPTARHLLVERHFLDGPEAFAGWTAFAQRGSDTRIIMWKPNGKRIFSISIYIFRRTLELDGLNFWEMIVTFFNFVTSFEVFVLFWRWAWRGSGETMWTFSPFRLQHTRPQTCKKHLHRSCETISLRNGTPSSLRFLALSKYFYGLRTGRKITQMQARRVLWKSLHVSRSPKDVCLRVSVSVCYGVNVLVSLERKVLIENGTKYNNSQSIMKHRSDKCHYIRDSCVRSRRWPSRVEDICSM